MSFFFSKVRIAWEVVIGSTLVCSDRATWVTVFLLTGHAHDVAQDVSGPPAIP